MALYRLREMIPIQTKIKKANTQLGYINIELNSKRLRIRCRKQHYQINKTMYPATDEGLEACLATCKMIEADIYRDCFDPTLVKYGLAKAKIDPVEKPESFNLKDVWEAYKSLKSDKTPQKTKHDIWRYVDRWLKDCPSECLEIKNADKFLTYLRSKYSDGTLSPRLKTMKAAFNLCIKLDKVTAKNPFPVFLESLTLPRKKQVSAFSLSEVKTIIETFRTGRFDHPMSVYSSAMYADLVEFRFLTGCRPSEAFALTWTDIKQANGKQYIAFNKRYSGGELVEGTKNGVQERLFPCNEQLTKLLFNMPRRHETLIFPSAKGKLLDNGNFTNRMWRPIVMKLVELGEVKEYLPFYDQRHTFGTYVLQNSNYDLKTISTIMGNSPQTLMKHYIAANEDVELPEF